MDKERMACLLEEGPPPLPGRLAWAPETTTLSAHCPVCGQLCDVVYIDLEGMSLGCNHCVTAAYVHDFAVIDAGKGGDAE